MGANCDVISAAGSWDEPTPGSARFADWLVRHEHLLYTYCAFFYLACFWITLRHSF